MKATLLFSLLFFSVLSYGQTKVRIDSTGNYTAVRDTLPDRKTGRYFVLKSGESLPVYITKTGKLYVWRVSKKTGNRYKQWLIESK